MKGSIFLSFAAGAVIGAGAAYVYFSKKFESAVQQELDSWNELKQKEETTKNDSVEVIEDEEKTVDISKYRDYSKTYGGEEITANNFVAAESIAAENEYPMENDQVMELIDEDIFASANGFAKIDLDLYMFDEALINAETDREVNPDDTIGYDIYNTFIDEPETRVIYVRNPRNSTEYSVSKLEAHFYD